ncbi:uncharacterized protein LOC114351331 [Ostrinia furnacalis]|uniref:uncharacterized protein LOC114351331 n=1 Tax=Ostrinia furnacalis TaxID=93504 RepID=UPI00103B5E89|nr:uncharacterized protein LOC114351331 [Ostrinia furnacalis]
MLSRMLRATMKLGEWKKLAVLNMRGKRRYSELVPPNQYDVPIPNRLKLGYALKVHWEIIPLFVTTCAAMSLLFGSIIWACWHKVDVVFSTHNRDNISRTMDLRNPSIHKIVLINQRYEPWPEMADLLDKMRVAERRVLARAQSCSFA